MKTKLKNDFLKSMCKFTYDLVNSIFSLCGIHINDVHLSNQFVQVKLFLFNQFTTDRYQSISLSLLYLSSWLPSVFATYFSIISIFSKMICLGKSLSFSINFFVSMIKNINVIVQSICSRKLLTQKVKYSLTCLVSVLPRDFLIPLCFP